MKPTEKQKKIINILIDQLKNWRDSNDIHSPTHNSDMEECIEEMEEDIGSVHTFELKCVAVYVFNFVKHLK